MTGSDFSDLDLTDLGFLDLNEPEASIPGNSLEKKRNDMAIRIPATAAILLVIPLACQTQDPSAIGGQQEDDGAMVVAELYGQSITAAELDEWIRDDLFNRETRGHNPAKVYEVRAKGIEKMIDERVMDTETTRLGLTPEELMEREVEALGGVTDEEIETFYAENSGQMGGATREEISPQIRAFLEAKKEGEALAQLRLEANSTVLLMPVRYEVAAEGPSKGPADAQITIIEFSDFQCPYCKRAGPIVDEVLGKYPKDVRLVYRHLPLANHSRAEPAAEAAVCADDQGKFWQYHDTLFENNRKLGDDDLLRYASEVGLDIDPFKQCLTSAETRTKVQTDLETARMAGISGTPAFLINGVLISGAKPASEFYKVIDAELK